MSEATPAPPADAGAATYLLTVRGTTVPATTEEARTLHNATAGNPAGVEAARSLGDLSHQVFTPCGDAQAGELLFIDFWNSLSGMGAVLQRPAGPGRREPAVQPPATRRSGPRPAASAAST